jgi:hypothetical protein
MDALPPAAASTNQTSASPAQAGQALGYFELEELADRIIARLKHELVLDLEREGKRP